MQVACRPDLLEDDMTARRFITLLGFQAVGFVLLTLVTSPVAGADEGRANNSIGR